MFDDPKVVAAVIAGTVSLIVSAISGFYCIVQNRKRFDDLRKELIAKASAETFIKAKQTYLDSYREYGAELVAINERNPHDGTEAIQFAVNFYAQSARDFYLRNRQFLQNKALDSLSEKISSSIESGTLNAPENHSGKREFGNNILSFCSKLHEQALVVS